MAKRDATTKDEFGWFDERQLAVIFGWKSQSAFRKTWRERMPADAVRKGQRTYLYWAAALHELICEQRVSAEIERAGGDPDLMGAGDSPALERLRAAKAKLAEMDVKKREGELVERAAVREMATLAVAPIHKALESACPTCGDAIRRRAKEIEAACGV